MSYTMLKKKSKTSIIGFKLKADKCITFFIQLEVKIFINVFLGSDAHANAFFFLYQSSAVKNTRKSAVLIYLLACTSSQFTYRSL